MQKNLLKLVYVPAIRLFQRYKTTNANTVTANNGPTIKYHCTVVLSEKKKTKQQQQKKKTKQNKKVISDYGSTKSEGPKAKQGCFLLRFIVLKTFFN